MQKGDPEGARKEGTAGGSPKRIEAAPRYRLQMAAVTWAVAGESEGARTVERLRGIVTMADVRLSQKGGHVVRGCKRGGGTLRATHMDGDRIRAYFGRCRKVKGAGVLEAIAREGVPAEVGAGENSGIELAYGNHRSALKHRREVKRRCSVAK